MQVWFQNRRDKFRRSERNYMMQRQPGYPRSMSVVGCGGAVCSGDKFSGSETFLALGQALTHDTDTLLPFADNDFVLGGFYHQEPLVVYADSV